MTQLKDYGTVGCTFEPCRVHASAATTYDAKVKELKKFFTNLADLGRDFEALAGPNYHDLFRRIG